MKTYLRKETVQNLERFQSGMTLIEVVIVILVLSIIAGVGVSKMSSPAALTIGHQAELAANHFRQAQALAVAYGCEMAINIATGSYNVTARKDYSGTDKAALCGDGATQITNPANGQNFSVSLDNGVQFGAVGNVYFDIRGRLTDAAGTPVAASSDHTLSGGGTSYQISVAQVTGFVSLSKI